MLSRLYLLTSSPSTVMRNMRRLSAFAELIGFAHPPIGPTMYWFTAQLKGLWLDFEEKK